MTFAPERPAIYTAAPATNTDALVTIPALGDTTRVHVRSALASYSTAPTGGLLTITDGTTSVELDVPAEGPVAITGLDLRFVAGAAVTCTLAAGGSSVLGKLTVTATFEV